MAALPTCRHCPNCQFVAVCTREQDHVRQVLRPTDYRIVVHGFSRLSTQHTFDTLNIACAFIFFSLFLCPYAPICFLPFGTFCFTDGTLFFSTTMEISFQKIFSGTSLTVQWLRLSFHCRRHGLNPWLGN